MDSGKVSNQRMESGAFKCKCRQAREYECMLTNTTNLQFDMISEVK